MTGTVVLRCNSGPLVGFGHLMRCRALGKRLAACGWRAVLVGPPLSLRTDVDAGIFAEWHEVPERGSSAQDAARVIELCRRHGSRHVIMDDYRTDPEYQDLLRAADLRWLQQFDASRPWRFEADVLVNASPSERPETYRELVSNPAVRLLLGPRYIVLRDDFSRIARRPDGRPVERVLVAFGGGDDRGAADLALSALAGLDVTAVVISGAGNPRNARNAELVSLLGARAELHVAPPNVAELMSGCDLALIAGGTMSYESAFCGLPMILLALAPNQMSPCRGWAELAGARFMGALREAGAPALHAAVAGLAADGERRLDMARRGRSLVDTNGARRLLDALLETGA